MIRANELRIGNFVLLDTGIVLPAPHFIQAKDIWDIASGAIESQKIVIEPIRITEQWLLDFGFAQFSEKRFTIKTGWYYDVRNEKKQTKLALCLKRKDILVVSPGNYSITLKYVHQLQNLYYALTGNELKII